MQGTGVHWFAYHRNFTARYLREITRGTPSSHPPSALNKPRNWFTFEPEFEPSLSGGMRGLVEEKIISPKRENRGDLKSGCILGNKRVGPRGGKEGRLNYATQKRQGWQKISSLISITLLFPTSLPRTTDQGISLLNWFTYTYFAQYIDLLFVDHVSLKTKHPAFYVM